MDLRGVEEALAAHPEEAGYTSAVQTIDIRDFELEDATQQSLGQEAQAESLQSRLWKSANQLEDASARLKELDDEVPG